MVRLGVATRLLGRSAPARPQCGHLSVGLIWLREVLVYLITRQISVYRIPNDLAACFAEGKSELIEQELNECESLVQVVQEFVIKHQFRLTIHLMPGLGPAAVADALSRRWAIAVCMWARLLGALGGPQSVIVGHVGGLYGNRHAALERAAVHIEQLPHWARSYLVLEPDEDEFGLTDLLWLHERCGRPVVLDLLHHQIHNPQQIDRATAFALAFGTWPHGQRPKIHMSTQRTEAHLLPEGRSMRIVPPRIGQHADFINPFEFAEGVRATQWLRPFDVMIEAKAADLALLRLREDTQRFAPDVFQKIDSASLEG